MKHRTYPPLLALALAACLLASCAPKADPNQSGITLTHHEVTLTAAGETFQLGFALNGQSPAVEFPGFASSDPSVVTVDETGLLTAVSEGTATISMEFGEDTCVVTCEFESEPPEPEGESLTLNATEISLIANFNETFQLDFSIGDRIPLDFPAFTSSDPSVATVDETGLITAVGPGDATVTAELDGLTAQCLVHCEVASTQPAQPAQPPEQVTTPFDPAPAQADLASFAGDMMGGYEFGFLELASQELLDNLYPGLSGVDTEQCLVYITMMSMNNGEFGLVQVKDSGDVDTVKGIFQARIDYMVGDGNGPGGAWYPEPTEQWQNNSRVVSNGNYVMMVVNEDCDAIVDAFNALF